MQWTPNQFKNYHPACKAFFEREISRDLANDIHTELLRQARAYTQYIPSSYVTPLDRDEHLRSDLLECLSFVMERIEL